jgi:class 3 adenylate cyclase
MAESQRVFVKRNLKVGDRLPPERELARQLSVGRSSLREAMQGLNADRERDDLLLKIGIHEGPCLAVTLNDRLDYFGQTVNIAARVQALAVSRSILATGSVVQNDRTAAFLATAGLTPQSRRYALRGIAEELTLYEIS